MICSYKDCVNVSRPCSSITFFSLPNDSRRNQWIVNACNESLRDIKPNCRRIICEKHFQEKDLRRQFNRIILKREAIPLPYQASMEPLQHDHHADECNGNERVESVEDFQTDDFHKGEHSAEVSDESEEIIYCDIVDDPNSDELFDDQFVEEPKESESAKEIPQQEIEDRPYELPNSQCHSSKSNYRLSSSHQPQFLGEDLNTDDNRSILTSLTVNKRPRLLPTSSKTVNLEAVADGLIAESIEVVTNEESSSTEHLSRKNVPSTNQSPMAPIAAQLLQNSNDFNNDETYFVLSLIGMFKRLPPQKRAIAKCNILQYLTDLEFGPS